MSESRSIGPSMLTKEVIFGYYSDFENYPVRYPKYCGQVSILLKSDNEVITKELWNIETPKEHELIEVKYHLSPPLVIKYEIIGENRFGVKNKMQFSDSKNSTCKSFIEHSLPMLDIVRRLYGQTSPAYEDLKIYFLVQDSMHMQNGQEKMFALGQTCLKCKTGKLASLPSAFTGNSDLSFRVKIEKFECCLCHEVFSNSMAVSGSRVGVSG